MEQGIRRRLGPDRQVIAKQAGIARGSFYQPIGRQFPVFGIARQIVCYVAEVKKPDGERMDGFHDSQLESATFPPLLPGPGLPGPGRGT